MKARMKDNFGNMWAVCHMIGQFEDMGLTPSASDVAAWMGVSKPTAIARLWRYVSLGQIRMFANEWRANAVVYHVALTEHGDAKRALYERHFKDWRAKKEMVESMKKNKKVTVA